jgi:hypothetical protein
MQQNTTAQRVAREDLHYAVTSLVFWHRRVEENHQSLLAAMRRGDEAGMRLATHALVHAGRTLMVRIEWVRDHSTRLAVLDAKFPASLVA